MNIKKDCYSSSQFYEDSKSKNIEQCWPERSQGLRTHHVAHEHLVINRRVTHEEKGEETGYGHHSQSTYLY